MAEEKNNNFGDQESIKVLGGIGIELNSLPI
jgi:hypothetical protein